MATSSEGSTGARGAALKLTHWLLRGLGPSLSHLQLQSLRQGISAGLQLAFLKERGREEGGREAEHGHVKDERGWWAMGRGVGEMFWRAQGKSWCSRILLTALVMRCCWGLGIAEGVQRGDILGVTVRSPKF